MTIAILGAMEEEVSAIVAIATIATKETVAGTTYHCGTLSDQKVVIAFSKWGKVAAAQTVTTMIIKYEAKSVIFIGVAGAANPELNIGDVVIAKQLFQYDMDASPLFKPNEIPLTGKINFFTDENFRKKARLSAEKFFSNIKSTLGEKILKDFNIITPKVVEGTIGTGDRFVKDSTTIKEKRDDCLAVDMESAAVAQVCDSSKIPFIVIRMISDQANHEAHINFSKFCADVATPFAAGLMKHFFSPSSATESTSSSSSGSSPTPG